ncbi:hypothetical protein KOW79_010442 [Hemibagrus wyckioides]|uniref:Uncharacterized protein n=1 Tax=Hemibagrus wyckioides TaxID=337641 RepID=A0A9D3NP45_9TELE|nr:hypothetical protein KOW79_010442 [Hemibagrus wyckioides]
MFLGRTDTQRRDKSITREQRTSVRSHHPEEAAGEGGICEGGAGGEDHEEDAGAAHTQQHCQTQTPSHHQDHDSAEREGEIEQEERGLVELERHFKALRLDMEKLNLLLNQNTQLKQELEQSNILMENSFIHTLKQAEEYDGVIALLQLEQFSLTESLRERKMQITDLKNTSSALQDELKNMQETKERNLIQLMALQSRVKQLQAVKEGRYRATARGEDELQLTTNTLQEHLHSIRDVLQRVVQDVPQHKPLFHRILLLLSVHTPSDLDRT